MGSIYIFSDILNIANHSINGFDFSRKKVEMYVDLYVSTQYIDYIDGKLDFSLLINISAGFEP